MKRKQYGWDEPIVCQLEELLTKNLLEMFNSAITEIYRFGYSMENGERTVLKSYIFHSKKDVVTNIVDGALDLLKRERVCYTSKLPTFSSLKEMADYTILEITHVLREFSPALTIVEAMWCLLICDMNLLNACAMAEEISRETQTPSQSQIPVIEPNETTQKIVSEDDSDDIRMLMCLKQALEKDLQGWTNWANDKVMEVARTLGKDKKELKMLRQEKEDVQKLERDRQLMKENAMTRLCDIEDELSNATEQIQVALSPIHHLEEEQSVLKEILKITNDQTWNAELNLGEAVLREQELMSKLQSCDAEKELHLEELTNLRQRTNDFGAKLENSKGQHDHFKALWRQVDQEKLEVDKYIYNLRNQREDGDACSKAEEDNIKQAAERDMIKYKEDIVNLENMISKLRLKVDQSKIASLSVGYGESGSTSTSMDTQFPKPRRRLPVFQGNFQGEDAKPDRECVMCMVKEISVVFLPCAHQVLCGECSARLQDQGMNDCPACRTPIDKRISVRYAAGHC